MFKLILRNFFLFIFFSASKNLSQLVAITLGHNLLQNIVCTAFLTACVLLDHILYCWRRLSWIFSYFSALVVVFFLRFRA